MQMPRRARNSALPSLRPPGGRDRDAQPDHRETADGAERPPAARRGVEPVPQPARGGRPDGVAHQPEGHRHRSQHQHLHRDVAPGALDELGQQAPLIINPIILAEISPRFERASDLEAALAPLPLVREALPWDAAFLAGQAFKIYRGTAGTKTSPMPDFYIGAHALMGNLRLLTRDATRYRRYYPRLALVCP